MLAKVIAGIFISCVNPFRGVIEVQRCFAERMIGPDDMRLDARWDALDGALNLVAPHHGRSTFQHHCQRVRVGLLTAVSVAGK